MKRYQLLLTPLQARALFNAANQMADEDAYYREMGRMDEFRRLQNLLGKLASICQQPAKESQ